MALYDKEKERVGYDEYTVMLKPPTITELKSEVGKNPARMEYLKAFLANSKVEKVSDLSKEHIESLFKEVVALP